MGLFQNIILKHSNCCLKYRISGEVSTLSIVHMLVEFDLRFGGWSSCPWSPCFETCNQWPTGLD